MSSSEPLKIASAEELSQALRRPEADLRLGLLKAIIANPAKAASYGGNLLEELAAVPLVGPGERSLKLAAMLAVNAVHTLTQQLCRTVLEDSIETSEVELARHGLSLLPVAQRRDFLLAQLNGLNATTAADLLLGDSGLAPEQQLEVALRSSRDAAPVNVPWASWMAALEGPYGRRALELLEDYRIEPEALEQLDRAAIRRLVSQSRNPAFLYRCWSIGPKLVLKRLLELGEVVPLRCCEEDPELMETLLQSGAVVDDPWRRWAEASHPGLKLEYLRRLSPAGREERATLLEALSSSDWRERAAARDAWVRSADWSTMMGLLDGPLRTEAIQILVQGEQEQLLATHLGLSFESEESLA